VSWLPLCFGAGLLKRSRPVPTVVAAGRIQDKVSGPVTGQTSTVSFDGSPACRESCPRSTTR